MKNPRTCYIEMHGSHLKRPHSNGIPLHSFNTGIGPLACYSIYSPPMIQVPSSTVLWILIFHGLSQSISHNTQKISLQDETRLKAFRIFGSITLKRYILISLLVDKTCTLRHGSAKKIFTLPTNTITTLYQSFLTLDTVTFNTIFAPLTIGGRNIPIRIFLPPPHTPVTPLVAPRLSEVEEQSVGTALHQVLPALFPSRRTCLFARPVCHGVIVPMTAHLGELSDIFCGGDGWLDIVVVMMSWHGAYGRVRR
jgi:hypothetical protein